MIFLNRCVIITSFQSAPLKQSFGFRKDDFIVCADGGYSYAIAEGIKPDVIIGDFDSMGIVPKGAEESSKCKVIRLSSEKDDTDTMVCLNYGIEKGFQEFYVLGGLGGRLDHTIANLQTMSHAVDQRKSIWFLDGKNSATMRIPGKLTIHKKPGFKISLFAFTEFCEGVCIQGVKYPLSNHRLNNSFPLGISNEFIEENAEISHSTGKLLVILSQD